jgi:membrane fusion protein (multidrug efflux system)
MSPDGRTIQFENTKVSRGEPVKKQLISMLAIVLVLVLGTFQLGCGGADDADAATGESEKSETAVAEAANTPGEESEDEEQDCSTEDCEDSECEGEDCVKKEEAVPVNVASLDRGAIESILRFSTNLEAESAVQVVSQARRLVTELLVEEGDKVKQGQVLLRLQDAEQRGALAKVESQLAKVEREYSQQERLFKQQLISQQLFDQATYEVEQLRISVEDAERELGYTEVKAPITGTVTNRMVNLGDQVQIGENLFDMVDFDSIVARIFVPEKHLAELRRGLVARISSEATRGLEFTGKILRISPIVDPRSGTVKVTIGVGGLAGLRPGMYVDVDLVAATHSDAILVPKRAVVYDNDQLFVFRLGTEDEGRRVEKVYIEPLLTDKFNIEPQSGLLEGDQLVVAGQAGLKDGALVSLPGDKVEEEDDDEEDDDTAEGDEQRAQL